MSKFDSMTNADLHEYAEKAVSGTPFEALFEELMMRNLVHLHTIETIAKAIDMDPKQVMTMASVADRVTGELDFSINSDVHSDEELAEIKDMLDEAGLEIDFSKNDGDESSEYAEKLKRVVESQESTEKLLDEAKDSKDPRVKFLMSELRKVFKADIESMSKDEVEDNLDSYFVLVDLLKQALK